MRTRRRRVTAGLATAVVATLLLGVVIDRSMQRTPLPVASGTEPVAAAATVPAAGTTAPPPAEVATADDTSVTEAAGGGDAPAADDGRADFERGIAALRGGDPATAIDAFHAVLTRSPHLPEAHVNLGFALLADGRPAAARDRFAAAIDIRPAQANAYWGLAVALEQVGDLEGALGAMRSFVHLTSADDPFLRRARAALWEWQETLAARRAKAATADGDDDS